jgi:uracil permease
MGGVCMTLYGFIAVSGLKMVQKVDLEQNKNVFTVSVILIAGIGGLTLSFGSINITSIACALILGILVNVVLNLKKEPVVDDTNADEE